MHIRELYARYRERIFFLTRYIISGGTAGMIQVIGLYVWVSVLGFTAQYLWGVVIAYCIAVVTGFSLQKYWTFRNYSRELIVKQMCWYTSVSLVNLGLNAFILHTSKVVLESNGFNFFHIWYLVVQVFAVGVCALMGFLLNRSITFRSLSQ
ncbi:MAG TPA: GtrA family protein [Candidatus Paceibacterota bacterium]